MLAEQAGKKAHLGVLAPGHHGLLGCGEPQPDLFA